MCLCLAVGCMAHSMTVVLIVHAWKKFSRKNVKEMALRIAQALALCSVLDSNASASARARSTAHQSKPCVVWHWHWNVQSIPAHQPFIFQSIEMSNKNASFVDLSFFLVSLSLFLSFCYSVLLFHSITGSFMFLWVIFSSFRFIWKTIF